MSSLKVNKILVTKAGKSVYEAEFHYGVNIIRGSNSSGKSTLLNFIFYGLGGEFTDWLPEALLCEFVYIEILANNVTLTLKRSIEQSQRRPMYFFYGALDTAVKFSYEGWNFHPYNKVENADSFSQVLFRVLAFPEVSTDNQESITINQILRLMYIDQLSALDSLMRNEDFDSPLIRAAIGNLLLGTYNDELLKLQLQLRQKEREFSEIKSQIRAIEDVLNNSPFEFKKEIILKDIDSKKAQLDKVLSTLREPDTILSDVKVTDTKNDIKALRSDLSRLKKTYYDLLDENERDKLEVIDNFEFIEVLQGKLVAIKDSLASRDFFGTLPLQYCPVCLEKLEESDGHDVCKLCKKEIEGDVGKSKLLRMQIELELQLKESNQLTKEKQELIGSRDSQIKAVERELRNSQKNLDEFVTKSRSSNENKFDRLFELKGQLMADIIFSEKQIQLIESYEAYKVQQFTLRNRIEKLKENVDRLVALQRKHVSTAYARIQFYALQLLKGDGKYEEKFRNGQNVSLDFGKNSFYLDNRNRFSASSMVLLKNCVRFAIFFASLELEAFRYPKFILCDNMEDKGMEESRSKNFQKNVVALAEQDIFKDVKFQIIFSTSMIAEELNVDKYTIGPFYDSDHKTLNLGAG